MKNLQALTDKTAIGLSLLCTFHCLALPIIFVLLPSLSSLALNDEAFHLWMLVAVIPSSAYALTLGCKQHKRYQLLACGLLGLFFLVMAVVLSEILFSEASFKELLEKALTFVGAVLIAYAHVKNYRLCQHQGDCNCSEHSVP